MSDRPIQRGLFFLLLCCTATAQVLNFPTSAINSNAMSVDAIQGSQMDFNNLFTVNTRDENGSPVQSLTVSVSQLNLKAPGKAHREYAKGFQFHMRRDWQGGLAHLGNATEIYPSFVAAHNALGSTYLGMSQNEQAREEFVKAVALDDHLPNSNLNLACAELALQQYPAAEESLRKTSSIAPLDIPLQLALFYGEFQARNTQHRKLHFADVR